MNQFFCVSDDLEIEIMINSPPGNSVESLALAHLRDAPSGNENFSSELSLSSPGNKRSEIFQKFSSVFLTF